MPSIVKTYDCDIDYLVVMGFDKGDEFYDSPEGQAEVRHCEECVNYGSARSETTNIKNILN